MSDNFSGQNLPPTFLSEGTVLNGRYRVEGFLGAGGFAAVYKAIDVAIRRPVAIKVLTALVANPDPRKHQDILRRFQHEATAMARIRHPNVVTIYDVGVTDHLSQPYIVMELMEGHPLDVELKEHGPIAPERATRLLSKCLEALDIGHRRGIVHKDLKPSNLYISDRNTRYESLRILDFGIARLQEEDAVLTGTGQILGTPQYLSPEYISHQLVSPALDVYQMGLLLVEMITARKVVDSENPIACAMAHKNGELPLPMSLMTSPLGGVIAKALAHNPAERYQDAGLFLQALTSTDLSGMALAFEGPSRFLREITQSLNSAAFIDGPGHTDDFKNQREAQPEAPTFEDMNIPLEERRTIRAPSLKVQALKRGATMALADLDAIDDVPHRPTMPFKPILPTAVPPPGLQVDAPLAGTLPIQLYNEEETTEPAPRSELGLEDHSGTTATDVSIPTLHSPGPEEEAEPPPRTAWLLYASIGVVFLAIALGLLGVVALRSNLKPAVKPPAPPIVEEAVPEVPPETPKETVPPIKYMPDKHDQDSPDANLTPRINVGGEEPPSKADDDLLGVNPLPKAQKKRPTPSRPKAKPRTGSRKPPAPKGTRKKPSGDGALEIYDF